MKTHRVRAGPRAPRGFATWLRACDDVSVCAGEFGYVRVTKAAAARLVRKAAGRVACRYVPEIGVLLIEPRAAGP